MNSLAALAAVSLIAIGGPASSQELPIPPGWHYVPLSAFKQTEDFHYREDNEGGGLIAIADFDGDGRLDAARVLESDDHRHCAVFITYHDRDKIVQAKNLTFNSSCTKGQASSMFVSVQPVDGEKIDTWCGRSGDCSPGDPKSLTLKHPAMEIGVYEVGYSLRFWAEKTHSWRDIPISD